MIVGLHWWRWRRNRHASDSRKKLDDVLVLFAIVAAAEGDGVVVWFIVFVASWKRRCDLRVVVVFGVHVLGKIAISGTEMEWGKRVRVGRDKDGRTACRPRI